MQQSHQRSCKPRLARLYLASPVARIWFVPRGVRSGFYACYGRRTRRVFLGDEFEGAGVTHVDLAGRFVAYEWSFCDRERPVCAGAVVVRDLKERRVRRAPIPDGHGHATALAVSRRGAVAWIRYASSAGGLQVRVLDNGGERVVAGGGDIDTSSLALGDVTAYWTQGGLPRAAPMDRW